MAFAYSCCLLCIIGCHRPDLRTKQFPSTQGSSVCLPLFKGPAPQRRSISTFPAKEITLLPRNSHGRIYRPPQLSPSTIRSEGYRICLCWKEYSYRMG